MEQPQGYKIKRKEQKFYKLKKALYGLKQAPQAWNMKIDNYFRQSGFQRSQSEPSLFVKIDGTSNLLIVCLYVDDLIYTKAMMEDDEMTDLGLMKYF